MLYLEFPLGRVPETEVSLRGDAEHHVPHLFSSNDTFPTRFGVAVDRGSDYPTQETCMARHHCAIMAYSRESGKNWPAGRLGPGALQSFSSDDFRAILIFISDSSRSLALAGRPRQFFLQTTFGLPGFYSGRHLAGFDSGRHLLLVAGAAKGPDGADCRPKKKPARESRLSSEKNQPGP